MFLPDARHGAPGLTMAVHMRTGLFAGGVLYALGQGCSLLWQWLLLRYFGSQGYAEVGLAHLGLLTVLFLADFGYASLFLREDPRSAGWELRWRQALAHRLLGTLVMALVLTAGAWWQWRGHGAGFEYVLAVLPAALFGMVSYSAPLLAKGCRLHGFAVQQVAMPVAIVAWLALREHAGGAGGMWAGAAVSLGYLVQMLINIAVFDKRLSLLLPCFGGLGMLGTALRLWLMGLAGTLHDRLTSLLLVAVAPTFLPMYLFLGYLLNGASGVLNQLSRLLLAEAYSETSERWVRALVSLILGLSALCAPLWLLAAARWGSPEHQVWRPLVGPVVVTGVLGLASGVLSALLIGRNREAVLLKVLLFGLLCSAVLQAVAGACLAPQLLLWGRLLCIFAVAAVSLHMCGMSLNIGGQAALLSMLLAATAYGLGTVGVVLSAILLLPVAGYAWRQRSLICVRPGGSW